MQMFYRKNMTCHFEHRSLEEMFRWMDGHNLLTVGEPYQGMVHVQIGPERPEFRTIADKALLEFFTDTQNWIGTYVPSPKEGREELRTLLYVWANKHLRLEGRYLPAPDEVLQHFVVTEEHLRNYRAKPVLGLGNRVRMTLDDGRVATGAIGEIFHSLVEGIRYGIWPDAFSTLDTQRGMYVLPEDKLEKLY